MRRPAPPVPLPEMLLACVVLVLASSAPARRAPALPGENGYDLWLRYRRVSDSARLREYRNAISHLVIEGDSPALRAAGQELATGLGGLLGSKIPLARRVQGDGAVVAGTPGGSRLIASLPLAGELGAVGDEGFLIRAMPVGGRRAIVIAANRDAGVLYGAFRLLRQLQTYGSVRDLSVSSAPRIKVRVLDHWDNLDRTVERGYAGSSLWVWSDLPDRLSPRYRDYARANASLGINGAVLTGPYLAKVAALAGVFRPYGLRVYLAARFSAPIELGGLKTADPLDPAVRDWWKV